MNRAAQEALRRLRAPKVNYMEIVGLAGGFSCGTCRFAETHDNIRGFCIHREVQAPVSLNHGCCNKFSNPAEEISPSDWLAFR